MTIKELFTGAATLNHIVVVVLFCAAIKMIGPNTRRVIAMMKHAKTIGDWPIVKHPRELMSRGMIKDSVAVVIAAGCPNPTGFTFLNVRPKAANLKTRPARCGALGVSHAVGLSEEAVKRFGYIADGAYSFVRDIIRPQTGRMLAWLTTSANAKSPAPLFAKFRNGFRLFATRTVFLVYDSVSQDVNLHRQVSFWSGSLENSNSLAGRFHFTTVQ